MSRFEGISDEHDDWRTEFRQGDRRRPPRRAGRRTVDTQNFVADVIEASRESSGDRRLLGALVRPLQAAGPGAGEGGAPGQWQGPHGQDQHRREPAARRPDAHPVDPGGLSPSSTASRSTASWARCPRASSSSSSTVSAARAAWRRRSRPRWPRARAARWNSRICRPPRRSSRQILQVDREHAGAIAGLARCQIAVGDLENAQATLALVPPAKAGDPDVLSAKAALELALNPVDVSEIGTLKAQIEKNPDDFQARLDLAVLLNGAGERARGHRSADLRHPQDARAGTRRRRASSW